MFGVGGPLAAQSRVRSCLSLMVLFGGGEVVNVGVTTRKKKGVPALHQSEYFSELFLKGKSHYWYM